MFKFTSPLNFNTFIQNHDISHFNISWNALVNPHQLYILFGEWSIMKKKIYIIVIFLLLMLVASACNSGDAQVIEVTRVVLQTVIVTQMIKPTIDTTQEPTSEASVTPKLIIDPAYYDGIVVITQYYTFLGHGLYEEAYRLFSSEAQQPRSLEDYVDGAARFFKTVEIHGIQPFDFWLAQQGKTPWPSPQGELRFVVNITAWGVGEMSGSVPSGQPQTLFISMVHENDGWKIDKFSTAPWRRE